MAGPSPRGDALRALPAAVDILEVRADLTGDLDPDWLRSHFGGRLLLHAAQRGGARTLRRFLRRAAPSSAACGGGLRSRRPRRRPRSQSGVASIRSGGEPLSSHGPDRPRIPENCSIERERMTSVPGAALQAGAGGLDQQRRHRAAGAASCAQPTRRRRVCGRSGGILDAGAGAVCRRAGRLRHGRRPSAIAERTDDRAAHRRLRPRRRCRRSAISTGSSGNPVAHSLSPRLHNAAYRALGLPGLFVPFQATSFSTISGGGWCRAMRFSIGRHRDQQGLTVASPHKEAALNAGASSSAMVQRASATNIFIRNGKGWKADTHRSGRRRGRAARARHRCGAVCGRR